MILNVLDNILNFFKDLWQKAVDFHNGLEQNMKYVLYAVIALVFVLIIVLIVCSSKKKKKKKLAKKQAKENVISSDEKKESLELKEEVNVEVVEETKPEEKVETDEVQAVQEDKVETDEIQVAQEEKVETEDVQSVQEEKETEESDEKKKVLGKYEIFQDSDFFKFVLKASNGEVLVDSEVYTSLDGAYKAVESVQKNISEGRILITRDKNNAYQFKLIAKNHRVLVVSANYSTEKAAIKASDSFKRFAIDSTIVELKPEEVVSTISKIKVGKVEQKQGGKIQVVREDGAYFFKLYASNNEMMCSSLDYKSKTGAVAGIETFKSAIKDGKFYVVKDKRSNYQFKLYSSSNRLVVVGQSYKNKTQAKQSASIVVSYMDNVTVETE